jgi:hypothetical protein
MARTHLAKRCEHICADIRSEVIKGMATRSMTGGGKFYWASQIASLGVYEDGDRLRFGRTPGATSSTYTGTNGLISGPS